MSEIMITSENFDRTVMQSEKLCLSTSGQAGAAHAECLLP